MIVSSSDSILFNPVSNDVEDELNNGKTYLSTYKVGSEECPDCEIVRYQGTGKNVVLPKRHQAKVWGKSGMVSMVDLTHNHFKVFAINGGNGKVVYSGGVEIIK